MKRIILVFVVIILAGAAILAWLFLGSGTAFSEKKEYLYIGTGHTDKASVLDSIDRRHLVSYPGMFDLLATRMNLWERVKPGRYEIKKGESLLSIVRMIRNNRQSPVNFTVNKLRVKEDLAKLIDKYFETDYSSAMDFLSNEDSLSTLGADSNTMMASVIPNTYTILWTSSPGKILRRLDAEHDSFWKKNNRKEKAEQLGFSPMQVTTIASIIEEETNQDDDKPKIASVYTNRYNKGMALGADPTVKFALKDFGLKRIYEKHLTVESPFNTYRNKGIPPGPICTPSAKTIDAVLNAPQTDYIFFVAEPNLSGHHVFTSNYADHTKHAHIYQQWLEEFLAKKKAQNK